ncbi:MAG: imidazole glycerol phosphate synthase subunit HisH [Verrucomicrobiae bacterium]|nr:imidazole glycerol phosphate synthase subunit HisH [Verrucomicrobiae bacterium]
MITGVIDYGAGNLHSVCNALKLLGIENRLVAAPEELESVDALIFPGVGAFGDCVHHLEQQQLVAPIRSWVQANRPFLGICLGYQVLFESSEECPATPGLAALAGKVVRFVDDGSLKIPHMGWNVARPVNSTDPLWDGLPEEPHFYFVHSYYPRPDDSAVVGSWTDYGTRFASAIRFGNIAATQFHPEKSQSAGLQLVENFVKKIAAPALEIAAKP